MCLRMTRLFHGPIGLLKELLLNIASTDLNISVNASYSIKWAQVATNEKDRKEGMKENEINWKLKEITLISKKKSSKLIQTKEMSFLSSKPSIKLHLPRHKLSSKIMFRKNKQLFTIPQKIQIRHPVRYSCGKELQIDFSKSCNKSFRKNNNKTKVG